MNAQLQDVNMAAFTAPKSDQLNADDLIGGPRTVTVTSVRANAGSAEQPVDISFEGDNGKPYKPCKSMRRVMVHVWGADAKRYVGRSMTLYCDPEVQFGGMKVGGIRISHMSHMEGPQTMALTATRARRAAFTVRPLQVQQQRAALAPSGNVTTVAGAPLKAAEFVEAYGKVTTAEELAQLETKRAAGWARTPPGLDKTSIKNASDAAKKRLAEGARKTYTLESALEELRAATSSEQLAQSFEAIAADYRNRNTELPIDIEAKFNELDEHFANQGS